MIQELKYLGYTAQPSDYDCPDGDLALSINLINEDGAIRPIRQPETLFNIGVGFRLFIHKIKAGENYITYHPRARTVKWIGSSDNLFPEPISIIFGLDYGQIVYVSSVGNILIFSTDKGLYYVRYNAVDKNYQFIGTRIPDIRIDFALKLELITEYISDFDFSTTTSGFNDTSTETWSTLARDSYYFDTRKGEMKHAFCPLNTNKYISSDYYKLSSALIFEKDHEYKIRWEMIAAAKDEWLNLYGCRNGNSELELITGLARESDSLDYVSGIMPPGVSVILEKAFNSKDQWTNIHIKVMRLCLDSDEKLESGETYRIASGNIIFFSGVDNSESDTDVNPYAIEYTSDNVNYIIGRLDKFVNERFTLKNKFIYPFFLRYAVRLYDGSYVYVSEPCLMIPNSKYAPLISYYKLKDTAHDIHNMTFAAFGASLRYSLQNEIPQEWHDLIMGVDFFASSPIWAFDQSKEYDPEHNLFTFKKTPAESIGYGKLYNQNIEVEEGDTYSPVSLVECFKQYAAALYDYFMEVAAFSPEEIHDKALNSSLFYKISSLSIEEICSSNGFFNDLEMEKGTLSSLPTHSTCPDNIISYQGFQNSYLKTYNNRLHVCNSNIILRQPVHPKRCFNFQSDDTPDRMVVYVQLATEEGRKIVYVQDDGALTSPWFFYPHNRAVKAYFIRNAYSDSPEVAEVDLKQHPNLNGAYWLSGNFDECLNFQPREVPLIEIDNILPAPSEIYVSEVNNPFVFESAKVVSIGASHVLALASAAKALSQGQFGQFPLYAFTDEGIWALTLSSQGSYSAVQPITRDQTVNIESVTQIDSAVLFASDRGIMLLSGSESLCLSNAIGNDYPFDMSCLKSFDQLHAMIGHKDDTCIPTMPFSVFIKDCRMNYDYPHQRIFIYNPAASYAYVYSLKSSLWGLVYSELTDNINSYPEAMAIDKAGNVINYSSDKGALLPALLLSRPIKLGGPDVLKTVRTVIQRGVFSRGSVKSVLYGSRDLSNWHLVWSSRDHRMTGFSGTPYKYFRIALVCDLNAGESLSGASIQFEHRQLNRLH